MRRLWLRSWSAPVVALAASLVVAVPVVVAGTIELVSDRAPAKRPAARAAQLPACTIVGSAGSETLVGTAGDDVICALGGDDVVRGGGGDDVLFGSFGNDVLDGGPGNDELRAHWGADRLSGGPGADLLHGGGNGDVLAGGGGADVADYSTRFRPVRVTIGRGAGDGVTGEDDDVRGDVEGVLGGSADDVLVGSARANRLHGRGGDDRLKGGGGDDSLWGNGGVDRLEGRDNGRYEDALNCGPGRPDAAMANARDRVADDCETVRQPERPRGGRPQPPSGGEPEPPPAGRPAPPQGAGNRAPTDVTLAPAVVAENRPAGATVGTLAAVDPDAGQAHTFAFAAGGVDNAALAIAGDQLRTREAFDFESKSSYQVRVATTDAAGATFARTLTVAVGDVNEAPSQLALAPAEVAENEPAGTTVGTLSVADEDAGQAHAFELVAGTGDADNDSFEIDGSTLRTDEVFDFETKDRYLIRVRATDNGGPPLAVEQELTVTVTDDPVEPPTADPKTITGIVEDDGATAIELSGTDVDGDALTFAIADPPTNGTLGAPGTVTCDGATPNTCTASVDYTPDGDFNGTDSFTYTAGDGSEDSLPATVSVVVDPVNDAPTASAGDRTTAEDTAVALNLGELVSDVETADEDLTYEVVTPPAHGTATATTYTPDEDFIGEDSLTYRVIDRGDPDDCTAAPCDGPETSSTVTVAITIDPVNDAPVATPGTRTTAEDTPLELDLADLVSDVETADGDLTYEIVSQPENGTATETTYTPDEDFNGTDSLTYRVTDRGDPDDCGAPTPRECDDPETSTTETVSVTVDPVNDQPVATQGSRTTDEDTPLTLNLADLVSDVETDDGDLDFEIVSQPEHGTATATTYTPDEDFNGADSLTYRVTDRGDPDDCTGAPCDGPETSSTETVQVTVGPVNDPPVASPGIRMTAEDAELSLDLASLVSDVETADEDLTYEVVTPPAHGTATATTYTPDEDFNGSDSLTYRVTDRGDPDNCAAAPCDGPEMSGTETVEITVGAVNDAPVNFLPAGPITATQDTDTPVTGLSVADVDAGADNVELALTVEDGTLTVATTVPGGVGAMHVTDNGTAAVTIVASLEQINTTLAADVGLIYRGDLGFTGPDRLTMTSDDLGHNGTGGARSDTDTLAIDVRSPNATPVAAAQAVNTNEDTPLQVTLSASDADGDTLSLAIATGPAHGSLGAIGAVTCGTTPNVCTAAVQYTPDADYNGPDGFTFTANDTAATSAPATVSVTVNPVNDAPSLQGIEAGALAYTENDPAAPVTASTTVADIDSANLDTGTLTVDYSTGGTADDRLEISNQGTGPGQIGVTGTTVTYEGTAIGTFAGGSGTTALVVTLNADATPVAVQALVRAVTYRNVSENPSTDARAARFVLTDGDGGASAAATRAIVVTAVNDPPALAAIETTALGYTENDPATAITSSLTVSDPDGNITGATVTIVGNPAPAQDELALVNQPGITADYSSTTGVLTLTGSATPAAYQSALRAVTYRNSSDNPNPVTRSVSFRAQDGPDPANQSNTQSRDVTVTPVNDAPVADDETFSGAVGNTTLIVNDPTDGAPSVTHPQKTITGDILDGDSDVDGPGPLTVTPGTVTSADGGSATLEADGDFTYLPAAGCADTSDSFNYTLEDSGTPEQTDTGTVTIQLAGCVWYVSNNANGNSGTASAPFDTLAQAEAASGANHTVFVFDGDNTSTGYGGDGYAMNAGERLIGEHEGLVVGTDTLFAANPGAHPTLTATNADVIDLDDGNEVRGLNVDPQGTGGGIAGTAGDTGGGTIDDINITDTGTAGNQPGLELNATTGTFNVTNLTVSTNGATGVLLNNAGTTDFGSTTITSTGAPGLDATGTNMGTSTFDAINVTGSTNGGVRMSGTTGTTVFGDGTGVDLALATSSGTAPAFGLNNAGTVTVAAAGTDNVSANGGPAIDVTGTATAQLTFDDVDSTNSSTDGINLDGLGAGTFTASSGDITGAAGIALDLNGGNGTITYPGALDNGSGATAEITGRSGGAVTLSGPIADSNDAGGGITVSGNTGGATTFSNASKTLNTGTSQAVALTNNTGHTIAFTGGGLDIDTTTGAGFSATGGGTVSAQGPSNSVTTTTGTAVNVAATTIAAAGMTFGNISANGAPNAIALNNTGAAGSFVVTGDGDGNPDGGGGTVTNTTSHALNLANTVSPSLTDMTVSNAGNADNEYGLHLTNVSGTVTLDDMTFNNAADNLVYLNSTTSSTINVTGSVLSYPSAVSATANSAMLLEPGGAANLTASITGTTFTNILSASTQIGANTAGASGTLSLTFANNTINSAAGRAGGVVVSGQELTATSLSITNNTFTGAGGNGVISIDTNDSSTVTGTISGNVISNPPGIGIFSAVDESATSTLTFNANTVTNAGGDGIQLVNFGGAGSSTMNATVTNNTVNGHSGNTAVSFLGGISVTGFEEVMDLQLTGNTVTGTPASPTQCGGLPCVDYHLEEVGGTFRLEEIPNTAATTANAAYVNSINDAGPVTIFGTIDLSNGVEISNS